MKITNTALIWFLHFIIFLPAFPSTKIPLPNPSTKHPPVTIPSIYLKEDEDQFKTVKVSVKPSSSWTVNSIEELHTVYSYIFKPIIHNPESISGTNVTVACGFFRNTTSEADLFYLVILAVKTNMEMEVLWTANRKKPVTSKATVEFNASGDLLLKDVGDDLVWSTNTSGKGVVGMKILGQGNLVLQDAKSRKIWSSWDYPSDTLVSGQKLRLGQKLYANVSPFNFTPGILYLSFVNDGLQAFVDSIDTPQAYMTIITTLYANFSLEIEGSHVVYNCSAEREFCYLRLDADGHIRHHQWLGVRVDDINTDGFRECGYPTVCGKYGICSNQQECSCPVGLDGYEYFKPIQYRQPKLGCIERTQIGCNSSQLHLLELPNVTYYGFVEDVVNTDAWNCKNVCLKNCSCKSVVFTYYENTKLGNCSFQSQVYSLNGDYGSNFKYRLHGSQSDLNWVTFLKVQSSSPSTSPKSINGPTRNASDSGRRPKITRENLLRLILLGLIAGAMFFMPISIGIAFAYKKGEAQGYDSHLENDDHLDEASDTPRRFSHEELKLYTNNFSKKIGGGGFGSVYEGVLSASTKIAVKRLDSLGQGRKEFFAEVKTIGSIRHVNLVKLIGFCSENSHKLLVYEYMCNGSLDKWIFNREHGSMCWQTRRKIILDIAKGIFYLHEQCRKTIVHLDIKPQNVLLDAEFNGKLSDFGLAKLIERDQSQVLTTLRGTRGYLAPEWFLNKRISNKVDVYSFGIVVLEIVCGRKNLDHSLPEEDDCLLNVVRRKAVENQLCDLVDRRNEEMLVHSDEVVEMIKMAISCLQSDSTSRPSMSKVVKILEGDMDIEIISDYSFLTLNVSDLRKEVSPSGSTPLQASILSGPR